MVEHRAENRVRNRPAVRRVRPFNGPLDRPHSSARRNRITQRKNAARRTDSRVTVRVDSQEQAPTVRSPGSGNQVNSNPTDNNPVDSRPTANNRVDSNRTDNNPADSSPTANSRTDSNPADSSRVDNSRTDSNPVDSSPADKNPVDSNRVDNNPVDSSRVGGVVAITSCSTAAASLSMGEPVTTADAR